MTKKDDYIPVRLSHLFRHSSVGAIVRGPKYLVVIEDIREWTDRHGNPGGSPILYVNQVRAVLNISQELRSPPLATQDRHGQIDGVAIPALRFPNFMRCPNPACGRLYHRPWKNRPELGDPPRCQQCDKRPLLEQTPWVLVHPDGHLADVPWHYLAHQNAQGGNQTQCRHDPKDTKLRIKQERGSKRLLSCACGASVPFGDHVELPYGNTRIQPWCQETPDTAATESDQTTAMAMVLEINDTRVHTPVTLTALVIPPESRIRKGSVLDRLYRNSNAQQKIKRAKISFARKSALQQTANTFRCEVTEIEEALQEIDQGYPLYGRSLTAGNLLESEYQALLDLIPNLHDDEDFVTYHHTDHWKALREEFTQNSQPRRVIDAVSRLIEVSRLKEIMVFKGFHRLDASSKPVPPDIIGESDWLPGMELYGEGLFFTLDETMMAAWEKQPQACERAREFRARFVVADLHFEHEVDVSARFLLLHTLAHLMIRQLELDAGYPAASLKERIYCTTGQMPMAGILIYVAVPDTVGSLGGVIELAQPRRFLALLSAVFDHALWCSLDPVCSEHEGQGPNLLNRAACHACALVPEPSCAYQNVLLDRTFIKGDPANGLSAFLDFA